MNFRFALPVLTLIVLLVQSPAWAAAAGEHWEGFSRTATATTGDITISPDRITFGNGASLPLAPAGSVPEFKAEGKTVNATLFRVTAPDNPVLMSRNRLCGDGPPRPVTFNVVWPRERLKNLPDLRSVAAFSGRERPTHDRAPHFCGTYNYEPAQIPITAGQSSSGESADSASGEAALFDHPVRVERIQASAVTDPTGETRCTYYPDLMVRVSNADSPNPDNATIVPVSGASQHPSCSPVAHGVPLKTDGYYLIGKKGPYLVFAVADPNGAQDFKIIGSGTGRQIFADSRRWTGFQSVAVENGALHIRYTRAVNGPCSIVKEGPACWAKLVRTGAVPRVMAGAPPSAEACAAEYRKGLGKVPAPADDPSIIFYKVDITLDGSGKPRVNSRGAVGCEPMP